MTTLREAAQQALEALEKVGLRADTRRGCDEAVGILRAALAQQEEPTRSLSSAGFKPRDTRLTCDECGGKFARQMLPIHKCEPAQEPMAWYFEARHIDSAWGAAVSLKHPGPEGVYTRNVKPLYTAPPRCPNCTSLEAQNAELDRKLAELEQDEPVEPVAWLIAQRDALLELVVEMDQHEGAEGWSEDLRVKINAAIRARGEQP